MFQYNRFWHFWFQLSNRDYSRIFIASLLISMFLIPAAVFFPPLWGLVVALPLIVSSVIALFTQISNFLYNRQNKLLKQLKAETTDRTLKERTLKEEIDLYLNRRVVCPQELLAGNHLYPPHDDTSPRRQIAEANTPLIFATKDNLDIQQVSHEIPCRNTGFKATGKFNQLYIKNVAAKDGLSEVAAREMAEILGFRGLIPSNTIAEVNIAEVNIDNNLVLSREKIKALIAQEIQEYPDKNIINTLGVQNAVAKFIFNLKMAAYRAKVQQEEQFNLLHIQKLIPDALDGAYLYTQLFNERVVLPGQFLLFDLPRSKKQKQRTDAEKIVKRISIPSFQKNFLLHLILGSQDANPGNTLFKNDVLNDVVMLHSIDHERIMPEDNYNITKRIPLENGTNVVEKDVENVFPIRLWLAGLPQANVPFTQEVMEKAIDSLNSERLLAYHKQKKLFSSAAVGAQLERVHLIKNTFEEELKKSKITLTPKELFLKLINNHPTYIFLKNELQLSDFHTFLLLGQIPEGADMSLLRHPLQWFPMVGMTIEATKNEPQGKPLFSEESFKSSHAHHLLFFNTANVTKMMDNANQPGLAILAKTSKDISVPTT